MSFALQKLEHIDAIISDTITMVPNTTKNPYDTIGGVNGTSQCVIKLTKLNPDFVIGSFIWNGKTSTDANDVITLSTTIPEGFRPSQNYGAIGVSVVNNLSYPYIVQITTGGSVTLLFFTGGNMAPNAGDNKFPGPGATIALRPVSLGFSTTSK